MTEKDISDIIKADYKKSRKRMDEKIKVGLTIREQVCNILRGRIFRGELPAGTLLSERTLSAELNISTMPIKEAFRVLSSEGLLTIVPRKGAEVSDIGKNKRYISYIRAALEGVASYFAAQMITDSQSRELELAINSAKEYLEQGDLEKLQESNAQIHEILRKAAGSTYLYRLLNDLREMDKYMRVKAAVHSQEERLQDYQEHYKIVEAVQKHDGEKAEELMRNHIRRGYERLNND